MKSILSCLASYSLLVLYPTSSHSQLGVFDPFAFGVHQVLAATTTMATLHEHKSEWHPGEVQIHELLHVPLRGGTPTAHGLPGAYGYRVAVSPLVAVGEVGFARPIAQSVLGLLSLADVRHDPNDNAPFGHRNLGGELVRPLQE